MFLGDRFLLLPEGARPSGILLNTFEYFSFFFKYIKFRRMMGKLEERKQKKNSMNK